ncbi:DNA primase [Candidatus Saccharibacteria bacterium]|nr:DNA primase [Candidatus Saccharibacteria bacterium]
MDAIEEVKSRLNIEDVIGEYIQLKRAGRNFRGLSPFTSEKTPSFMVSPEKQIWHDFSSGKGGNVFSFVMEMDGLDFKGALEQLARKAGVDLDQYNSNGSKTLSRDKEQVYEALELAAKFYQKHFTKNARALEYVLKQRGFNKETVLKFKLGYSPNTGNALVIFLKSRGVSEKCMKQAGLTTSRASGLSDMFRGRIMIPLCDQQGKVIGFTARLLNNEANAPKYINTPQTIVYDKSRHVFGLANAKEAIRKQGFGIMVEGNLDVISSHQAGILNVVATAGTALTESQLKILKRFAGEIKLAFDQDRAGIQAAERALPIASKTGVNLSVITIPEGKDPDELIMKSPKLWEDAISSSKPALDWLIDLYKDKLDLETATGKSQFSNIVMNVIRELSDSVEQEHYIEKVAEIIGVSKEALLSKMNTSDTKQITRKKPKLNQEKSDNNFDQVKYQNQLLALCLMRPGLRKYLEYVEDNMLQNSSSVKLFDFLKQNPDFDGDIDKLKDLKNIIDYVKMLVLQYEELYQMLDSTEQIYEAERLQVRLVENYVKNQKTLLAEQMELSNEKQTNQLLEKAKILDALLKKSKELVHGR